MVKKVFPDIFETLKLEICLSRATDSSLMELAQTARRLKFLKGEYVFNDGDASEYFYLVESGRVILSKDAPSGKAFTFLIATRGLPLNAVACFKPRPRCICSRHNGHFFRCGSGHPTEYDFDSIGRIVTAIDWGLVYCRYHSRVVVGFDDDDHQFNRCPSKKPSRWNNRRSSSVLAELIQGASCVVPSCYNCWRDCLRRGDADGSGRHFRVGSVRMWISIRRYYLAILYRGS